MTIQGVLKNLYFFGFIGVVDRASTQHAECRMCANPICY